MRFEVIILLLLNISLKLGLDLADVHVLEQRVHLLLELDGHECRLATLALEVLQDLVIGRDLLLVFGENAANAIDCRVSHELLEVRVNQILLNTIIENDVKRGAHILVIVLIVAHLRDAVRQIPGVTGLAISIGDRFLFSLGNLLVEANIDEGLLVEEDLLLLVHQLLGHCLEAEASLGLD